MNFSLGSCFLFLAGNYRSSYLFASMWWCYYLYTVVLLYLCSLVWDFVVKGTGAEWQIHWHQQRGVVVREVLCSMVCTLSAVGASMGTRGADFVQLSYQSGQSGLHSVSSCSNTLQDTSLSYNNFVSDPKNEITRNNITPYYKTSYRLDIWKASWTKKITRMTKHTCTLVPTV